MKKTHIYITLKKNQLSHVHKLIFVSNNSFIVESFDSRYELFPDLHLPLTKLEDAIETFILQILNDEFFNKWTDFRSYTYDSSSTEFAIHEFDPLSDRIEQLKQNIAFLFLNKENPLRLDKMFSEKRVAQAIVNVFNKFNKL